MRRNIPTSHRRFLEIAVSPRVLDSDYAVRGSIVARAELFDAALRAGRREIKDPLTGEVVPFSFDRVEWCNVGNPLAMGQRPLTFPREVAALAFAPHTEGALEGKEFSDEAKKRAKEMIKVMGGWNRTGAYSMTKGFPFVRESVASFIKARDGVSDVSAEDLCLTNGASSAIEMVLAALGTENAGVLIPIPQYPLYSAVLTVQGSRRVGYELDESASWSVSARHLDERFRIARRDGIKVRAVVVINPGNPTGQVLTVDAMREIAEFCARNGLILLADEVYQANVYSRPFVSFYKVCSEMGDDSPPLISFHSTSKGYYGECGFRGGYMHFHRIYDSFLRELIKLASTQLCAGVPGQLMMDLLTNEPDPATDAGKRLVEEKSALAASFKRRAETIVTKLNGFEGIQSNPIEGAMYAFPSIRLPPRFIREAAAHGIDEDRADGFWAEKLLDTTGIVVVPGSGFGQKAGTYHFRTTILPPEERIEGIATAIGEFQISVLRRYDVEVKA